MTEEELLKRIVTDPTICSGKPHVSKTFMKVSSIIELLTSGWDSDEIIAEYPYLTDQDIQACVLYAKKLLQK